MNGFVPHTSRSIEHIAGLLDVTNEKELEAFLRRLIDGVARRSGATLAPDSARAVLAIAKKTAELTLPTLTTAFGASAEPAKRGHSPVETAARVYGLELEGLSAEDRDFEIARQFIRFAEAATHQAANPPSSLPAATAVSAAIAGAAREFAPGLPATRPATPERPIVVDPRGRPLFEPCLRRRNLNERPYESHSRTSTKGIPHV
jgi:hypothetical protein